MELSSVLLKILVCPVTGGKLIYDRQNRELISESAGLAYPIIDGIPMLLADQARKISVVATNTSAQKSEQSSKNKEAKSKERAAYNKKVSEVA